MKSNNEVTMQVFNNETFGNVRVKIINDEPWFMGRDVCKALGYVNNRKALQDHVDMEDKRDGVTIRDSIGRMQKGIVVNESGLYSLILSSKLDSAKDGLLVKFSLLLEKQADTLIMMKCLLIHIFLMLMNKLRLCLKVA